MKTLSPPFQRKRTSWLLALVLGPPMAGSALAAAASPPQSATISAETAAQALNQTWQIANDATVEVHNVRGDVVVSAGDAGQASLSGELGAGSRLVIGGSAQHLELRVDSDKDHGWFGNNGPRADTSLNLKVPSGVSLQLHLVSADGKVSGIDGKSLNVGCVSGKLTIDSGSPQVDVESVSGDIGFHATRGDAGYRTHLQTVSGDIELTGASGRVKLDTVSGRAHAEGKEIQEFEAGSVSGNVELVAALGKHGRVQAGTMSGDIRAEVPAQVSARIEAETFSGRIRSDFGTVKKPEYGPGSSLDAQAGDGDAQISVKSFSGNVDIRKKP
jgi:DUF4097 and DUF4098 domain-containing protein YvlB